MGLGPVAQSVEQRIENPCVGGSIPPQATKVYLAKKPTHAVGFFVSGANSPRVRSISGLLLFGEGFPHFPHFSPC